LPGASFDPSGQAEIRNVRLSLAIYEGIAGLEVAVQDAALMGMVHRPRSGCHELGRRLGILREAWQLLSEAAAFD
jgi:hypothetical protein